MVPWPSCTVVVTLPSSAFRKPSPRPIALPFCTLPDCCYAYCMARDRILQALGRIDSALLRLEALPMPLAQAASALEPGDRAVAQEALAALDQLIADIKADHG